MAEVLVRYVAEVADDAGVSWVPQACGGIASDGLWEGWIEFVAGDRAIRTPRETEQVSRDALMYWAEGLTETYLQGALSRATTKRTVVPREPLAPPRFGRPAPSSTLAGRTVPPSHAILDPFTTLAQGEDLLRGQLAALSHDNLVAIVEDYGLQVRGISDMTSPRLLDAIVDAVKEKSGGRETAPSARRFERRPDHPPT